MFLVPLLLLLLAAPSSVSSQEFTQPGSLTVQPGQSLTITCQVSYSTTSYGTGWIRQPAGKALEWVGYTETDGTLYYKDSLKTKFTMTRDTSSRTLTLKGQNLQTEDTAVYYCARHLGWGFDYWGKGTQVTVSNDVPTAPSSILTFRDCGQSTDTVTLGCLAKDFMPGIVTFNWTNVGTEIIQYPPVLGNGKYTGFSQVSIPRSDWDRDSSFNCTVEHSAGIKFATIDKKVPKSIVILMSQPHEDNDTQYLTCIMKDFATKDFIVTWKKNNNVVVGQTWAAQADSGLYSASSLLTVSMTDWNSKTEYTCEVSHKGQVFTKKISNVQCPGPAGKDRQSTRDSGEVPTVSVHLLPEEDVDKLANTGEVTLICLVTSSYPCDYFIKWRENEGQYKNGVTSPPQRTPDGSKYLVTSVYTTTKASWMSNKVTCAALNGLDNSMAPTKQRGVTKDLATEPETNVALSCKEDGDEEDDFKSLWSTTSTFIFLFLLSFSYSILFSLVKMKK